MKILSACLLGLMLTFSLQADWYNDYITKPVIDAIESNDDDSYVFLNNGATLKLRPVLYFIEKGEYPKLWVPNYYLARKEFASVQDLFSSEGLKHRQVFAYHKGQDCQILLPSKNEKRETRYITNQLCGQHEYIKFHGYWCWNYPKCYEKYHLHANYKTIPLNFHDTSVNLGPLRANLYEYDALRSYHFYTVIPNTYDGDTYGVSLTHGHLIEADLLEFNDHIQSNNGDTLKLKASQINALLIQPETPSEWEIGDQVIVTYEDQGMYTINNLSKSCDPIQAYLGDDAYSDLRNHPIFEENGFN